MCVILILQNIVAFMTQNCYSLGHLVHRRPEKLFALTVAIEAPPTTYALDETTAHASRIGFNGMKYLIKGVMNPQR
jgi:hypothetical protein